MCYYATCNFIHCWKLKFSTFILLVNHSYPDCYCDLLDTAAAEAMELEEEDLIEIAEEADLIQAERIIDDNLGHRVGKNDRKKGDTEEALRQVEQLMLAMNLDKAEIQAQQSEEGWEVN